ncbi:rod-determining factor RdfA [Natrinema halophilum]|uniref:rod-determining factor RdfA n=1 Tax=Natrinema halophilum TaxID=1699371 RepID=UPI0031BB0AA1
MRVPPHSKYQMPTNGENQNSYGESDTKVARLIKSYNLDADTGDRLEELWTADGDRRESLRDLADRFNKALLETAVAAAGVSTVDGEIDNLYRLLTSDDVSSGNRTEARARLEKNGVDVDQLEHDFVTYQAIRSYLKKVYGAEYERDSETTRVDKVIETSQRLQSRIRSVTEKSLTQLKETNQISLGEFHLFIDITVLCEDCNTQYGLVELLREGSCECQSE